ncbi:MAG TPA: hypothetical protein VEQ59_18630 [Polyangiaceae bacterium]|nr:hypothetical protein [Polyangiaceae bacterium]
MVTWATTAVAQPTHGEAVRLEYAAPPECPDAASFVAQVRARTERGRLAEPEELARTFKVVVAAAERGFSGSIEFLDESGASVSRRVPGEQCEAVVSSLALITALALDATLRGDDDEPVAAPTEPVAVPIAVALPAAPRRESKQPSRVMRRSLEGARLGLLGGYGTALGSARLGVLGQLDWRSGVSLRLTAHYRWRELTVDAGRSVELRSPGIEVSLCPKRFRIKTLTVAPCAALDVGWLRAEGVLGGRLASARADTIAWAAAGARVGVAWEPSSPFWLEVLVAAEFPLRAGYRFRFERPEATAYQVPYLATSGALATGVRFW